MLINNSGNSSSLWRSREILSAYSTASSRVWKNLIIRTHLPGCRRQAPFRTPRSNKPTRKTRSSRDSRPPVGPSSYVSLPSHPVVQNEKPVNLPVEILPIRLTPTVNVVVRSIILDVNNMDDILPARSAHLLVKLDGQIIHHYP